MADTSSIMFKPQNKSSDGNTTDTDQILHKIDTICPQCGHDHSHKPIGGTTILNMISFLDRNSTSER